MRQFKSSLIKFHVTFFLLHVRVSRVSAADEEFDDLNTMMTTVDFADGMETTVTRVSSSLHSQSSLIRGAPSPPTHNPGSSSDAKQIQKQGKSIKTKIKEKLFSRKKYEQAS